MQAPDPIETIMARLMPPALNQEFQVSLEETIEELAGPAHAKVVEISSGKWLARWTARGGIAAAIGLLGALYFGETSIPEPKQAADVQPLSNGFVVISETDRVESMTDEGLHEAADGSAMHALRIKAVEKNQVLDQESGILIEITEPREEILLTPISDF